MYKLPMPPPLALYTSRLRASLRVAVKLTFVLATAASANEAVGEWLVGRGHTIGLATREPTARDAERVLIWMEAASRVAPDLSSAYLWQYDLLMRLGQTEPAMTALTHYCRLEPQDISARIDLLEGRIEACQSVEERVALCRRELGRVPPSPSVNTVSEPTPSLSPLAIKGDVSTTRPDEKDAGADALLRSALHRRLADLLLRAGDTAAAETEARLAAEAFPGNASALGLLVELAGLRERPARQVRASLAALAAAPGDIAEMWRLARSLGELGLFEQSVAWYERTAAALERGPSGASLPVEFVLERARAYADAGRFEQALDAAESAVAAAPDNVAARFVLLDAATRLARTDVADAQKNDLRRRFEGAALTSQPAASMPQTSAATSGPAVDTGQAVHAAWYYLLFEPDAGRARHFASAAAEAGHPGASTLAGLAELLSGDYAAAERILAPSAERDSWAAAGLGEALLKFGRRDDALRALRAGERLTRSGPAHERIASLLVSAGESLSPAAPPAEVAEALRRFDPRVLEFPLQPAGALRLEADAEGDWSFGEPWRCRVRLTNIAPYPVFIGEGRMTEGRVLVRLFIGPESPRALLELPVSLHEKPMLPPGASVSRIVRLDVGPAAKPAAFFPQRKLELKLQVILDPLLGRDGQWHSALVGFPAADLNIQRPALDATRATLDALIRELGAAGSESPKMRAVRVLAALVHEREAAIAGTLDYTPRRVDELQLARELTSALRHPAAAVRAAALDAQREITFTRRTWEQVAPLLSDPDWLVRLICVDVLFEKQGEKFRNVLERLASSDGDALIRRAARWALDSLPASG